jgi:HD-GYP domain-containing protein (c-di-GMP phosphodiesterase class II)
MNLPDSTAGAFSAPVGGAQDPRFIDELGVLTWMFEEVSAGQSLPVREALAITHSVYAIMHAEGRTSIRLAPVTDMREYGTVHALNVAILAMGLAEQLGFESQAVRTIGLAGLLHDVGMVRIPIELITKSAQLEAEDRRLIQEHPVHGARIIAAADASFALAAVVAYEHHIRPDGSGYPVLRYPRSTHQITRLVQVCDTYHALQSPRPAREPWPADVIFSFLQQRAGTDFDPDMATRLIALIAMNEG